MKIVSRGVHRKHIKKIFVSTKYKFSMKNLLNKKCSEDHINGCTQEKNER